MGRFAVWSFFDRWRERVREAAGDMFLAFTVSKLIPAFVVLLVGTVFTSVVFIVVLIVKCLCKCKEEIKIFVHYDNVNVVLVSSLRLQICLMLF